MNHYKVFWLNILLVPL